VIIVNVAFPFDAYPVLIACILDTWRVIPSFHMLTHSNNGKRMMLNGFHALQHGRQRSEAIQPQARLHRENTPNPNLRLGIAPLFPCDLRPATADNHTLAILRWNTQQ
jgi:hypothetical protein